MLNKKKKVMFMYEVIHERLKQNKDPYDMINHCDIQITLCRLFHTPKQITNKIILELLDLDIIEQVGKNQLGIFYRVK